MDAAGVTEALETGELNLSGRQLHLVPPLVFACCGVQVLNLSANSLTSLPAALSELKLLVDLDVSFNQLRELPACVGALTCLTSLRAQYNQIEWLHAQSVSGLGGCLQELVLADNALNCLPPELGCLGRLRRLDLRFNTRLTALPTELGALAGGLAQLRLEGCPLGSATASAALPLGSAAGRPASGTSSTVGAVAGRTREQQHHQQQHMYSLLQRVAGEAEVEMELTGQPAPGETGGRASQALAAALRQLHQPAEQGQVTVGLPQPQQGLQGVTSGCNKGGVGRHSGAQHLPGRNPGHPGRVPPSAGRSCESGIGLGITATVTDIQAANGAAVMSGTQTTAEVEACTSVESGGKWVDVLSFAVDGESRSHGHGGWPGPGNGLSAHNRSCGAPWAAAGPAGSRTTRPAPLQLLQGTPPYLSSGGAGGTPPRSPLIDLRNSHADLELSYDDGGDDDPVGDGINILGDDVGAAPLLSSAGLASGAGDATSALSRALEDLAELPPAAAAVMYRSLDMVVAGVQEMREGRPLSRGGTAFGVALPRPSSSSCSQCRPVSSALRTSSSSSSRSSHGDLRRPSTALLAASSWLGTSCGGGWAVASSGVQELTGAMALLASAGMGAGAVAGGGQALGGMWRPQSSEVDRAGNIADSGVSGLGAMGPITFPLASGVRSMLRGSSGRSDTGRSLRMPDGVAQAQASTPTPSWPGRGSTRSGGAAAGQAVGSPAAWPCTTAAASLRAPATAALPAVPAPSSVDSALDQLDVVRQLLAGRHPQLLEALDQQVFEQPGEGGEDVGHAYS